MSDTDLLTLPEARDALRLRDDDEAASRLLEAFIEGVTDVVEEEVGWCAPRSVTLTVKSRGGAAVLPRTNIRAVTAATLLGGDALDLEGVVPDSATGIVYGLPDGTVTLTLDVGFTEVPSAIKRGAAEVLINAWQTQRAPEALPAFLIPYRAAAWLKPFSMGPSIR